MFLILEVGKFMFLILQVGKFVFDSISRKVYVGFLPYVV
jgi:hypothetical protein